MTNSEKALRAAMTAMPGTDSHSRRMQIECMLTYARVTQDSLKLGPLTNKEAVDGVIAASARMILSVSIGRSENGGSIGNYANEINRIIGEYITRMLQKIEYGLGPEVIKCDSNGIVMPDFRDQLKDSLS